MTDWQEECRIADSPEAKEEAQRQQNAADLTMRLIREAIISAKTIPAPKLLKRLRLARSSVGGVIRHTNNARYHYARKKVREGVVA